jgi:hypothetical protein
MGRSHHRIEGGLSRGTRTSTRRGVRVRPIAIPLASRGYRVSGLELSELLLRSAREAALVQGVRLPLVVDSMARLPFRDSSFDAVICLWSAYCEVLDQDSRPI